MHADHDPRPSPNPLLTFEEIYIRAGQDFGTIPWASLAANPALVSWLDQQPSAAGGHALVIGCGLGDDAQEVAGRGYRVTAFDLSPTAIRHCRERFPRSAVDYQVADLFHLPARWDEAFSLVVEIRTLQSLPLPQRADATAAIAATVRPGGQVFVRCLARDEGEPPVSRPWPLSRGELAGFHRRRASVRPNSPISPPPKLTPGSLPPSTPGPGRPELPERRETT